MLKPCALQIDVRQHEIENRGTPMFPCGGYITEVGDFTGCIPWHWHEEIEVLIVTGGVLKLEIPDHTFLLKKGEAAFINSSILHAAVNAEGGVCGIESFVFDPSLIFGTLESAIEQKYVRPLISCAQLGGIHFKQELQWHKDAIRCIQQGFNDYRQEPFGYELLVRERLSKLWFLIVSNLQDQLKRHHSDKNTEAVRVKDMLAYIHAHYAEPISLKNISDAAAVSARECLRCFNKVLGTTPMKHLLNYRISVAAGLLSCSEMNITEICRLSGFESPSYFSLKFKALTGMTPREYRRQGRQGG